jgi:hypothetical protein
MLALHQDLQQEVFDQIAEVSGTQHDPVRFYCSGSTNAALSIVSATGIQDVREAHKSRSGVSRRAKIVAYVPRVE